MSIERNHLIKTLNKIFKPQDFKDYGPNGLQIEGKKSIKNIAFAVSATLDSIEKAIDGRAQALIVHHGLLWNFHGVRPLTGHFGRRISNILRYQINLFGFHLPLDAHPEIGNAKSLGNQIDLQNTSRFGDYKGCPTGIKGNLSKAIKAKDLKTSLEKILNHPILMSSPGSDLPIKTIGIITGGAHSGWKEAEEEGLDAYITGEMSEHDWHESQEAGVHMFAGGHHATEKFGIQSLQEKIQKTFLETECFFIDSENPA